MRVQIVLVLWKRYEHEAFSDWRCYGHCEDMGKPYKIPQHYSTCNELHVDEAKCIFASDRCHFSALALQTSRLPLILQT